MGGVTKEEEDGVGSTGKRVGRCDAEIDAGWNVDEHGQ